MLGEVALRTARHDVVHSVPEVAADTVKPVVHKWRSVFSTGSVGAPSLNPRVRRRTAAVKAVHGSKCSELLPRQAKLKSVTRGPIHVRNVHAVEHRFAIGLFLSMTSPTCRFTLNAPTALSVSKRGHGLPTTVAPEPEPARSSSKFAWRIRLLGYLFNDNQTANSITRLYDTRKHASVLANKPTSAQA